MSIDVERFIKEVQRFLQGLPLPDPDEEDYKRGYHAGYRDGVRYVLEWLEEKEYADYEDGDWN